MTKNTVFFVLFVLACACGATESIVPVDVVPDKSPDIVIASDNAVEDIAVDYGPGKETVAVPACKPGEGCQGELCGSNDDCQSGWCVDHMGEAVCTQACQEECPSGWTCQQVAGSEPDLIFVCVSDYTNLCRPCRDGNDCKAAVGAEDVCVSYGTAGAFCGGACGEQGECPWGFACQDVETVDGISTTQCVANAGECPCTARSVELSLWTECKLTNEFGSCAGKRVCEEPGLTECDAVEPAAESCNGADDDCDGDVDEPDLVEGDFVNLCEDGNDCTEDSCHGVEGCVNLPLNGGQCNDNDPCTVADHCKAGVCVGDLVECDDGNPCTNDVCSETGGCDSQPNSDPCDDLDPCTVKDSCFQGNCEGYEMSCDCQTDDDCSQLEDGDLCNGTLVCDTAQLPYKCAVDDATIVSCPQPEGIDGFCLQPACNPETAECSLAPSNQGLLCDNGDECTLGDTCVDGQCAAGAEMNCNDGNVCTDDGCEAATGCTHTENVAPCSDGDVCTTGDQCLDGQCTGGAALECADNNLCTDDSCHPQVGCTYAHNQAQCSDMSACTVGDACLDGVCIAGELDDCDDGHLCTTDSCHPDLGCVHVHNQAPCNDGDVCTISDSCQAGSCQGMAQLECDDGNQCTTDFCDPEAGCQFILHDDPCDDGNLCTENDKCAGGWCLGQPKNCTDDTPCTDDSCHPEQGCQHAPNQAPCSDGNVCTMSDSCQAGVCQGAGLLPCDDGNQCTTDSCAPQAGCQFALHDDPCDDNNLCTDSDVCVQGVCQGQPANCDDDKPCTDDSCHPEQGCVNTANSAACDDGDSCTMGDTCVDGACQGTTCQDLGMACQDGVCASADCASLAFDGDDSVGVTGHAWNGDLTQLTVEAWIKLDPGPQQWIARIVNRHLACGVGATNSSFSLHLENTNVLRLWVCTTGSITMPSPGADVGPVVGDGKWHHVAGTWAQNGVARVYLDGKMMDEVPGGDGVVGKGNLPLFLGGVPPYGQHLQGRMSGVRISTIVRYDEDFAPEGHLLSDQFTLNLWELGEGQGNTVQDVAPNGKDGDITGATWVEDAPWPGCCTPDCAGKECGDNGCTGNCGECTGAQDACVDGQCVCQPACEQVGCGDDGCGGSCGICGWQCLAVCGDDQCDSTESCSVCAEDCAPCPGGCGNGVKEGGEQCDDGNLDDGDLCSNSCTIKHLKANTTISGSQRPREFIALDYNSVLAAWQDDSKGDWDVRFRRFTTAGAPLDVADVPVLAQLPEARRPAGAVALAGSRFGLFWRGESGAPGAGVWPNACQLDQPDQTLLGGDEFAAPAEYSVTALPSGELFVAWTGDTQQLADESGQAVYLLRLFDGEDPLEQPPGVVLANNLYDGDQQVSDIAAVGGDRIVVLWNDYGAQSESSDIWARLFDRDANPLGSQIKLNAITSNEQNGGVVAGLPGVGFVAAWSDRSSGNREVRFRRFDPDGVALDASDIMANTLVSGYQGPTDVAANADGDFLLMWNDGAGCEGGCSNEDTRARMFNDQGNALMGSDFLVSSTASGFSGDSRAAPLPNGDFVVIYDMGPGPGSTNTDVYLRLVPRP